MRQSNLIFEALQHGHDARSAHTDTPFSCSRYYYACTLKRSAYCLLLTALLAVAPVVSRADEAAEKLLKHCIDVMSHAQTFQAEATTDITPHAGNFYGTKGTLWMQRNPAYSLSKMTNYGPEKPSESLILNRGDLQTTYRADTHFLHHSSGKLNWSYGGAFVLGVG